MRCHVSQFGAIYICWQNVSSPSWLALHIIWIWAHHLKSVITNFTYCKFTIDLKRSDFFYIISFLVSRNSRRTTSILWSISICWWRQNYGPSFLVSIERENALFFPKGWDHFQSEWRKRTRWENPISFFFLIYFFPCVFLGIQKNINLKGDCYSIYCSLENIKPCILFCSFSPKRL